MQDAVITFTHTGVPPTLDGRGIGNLLVKTGLQYTKDNNLKITNWLLDYLSSVTISPNHHFQLNHYQDFINSIGLTPPIFGG